MDCAEQYGGGVTFMWSETVNSYKSEIQRMYANGHEIGNHTQDHWYLQKLGAQEIRQQVEACNQAVAAITGEAPKTVRLPGGGQHCACNIQPADRTLGCGYAGLEDAQWLHRCRPKVKPGKRWLGGSDA